MILRYPVSTFQRILVVTKFRFLGDNIVATPVLRRLKEGLPNAEITLLAGPAIPTLLKGCPYLEAVIPFDSKGKRRIARNMSLIRLLRRRNFDAVFLINRSLHSALIARLASIPVRIGFNTEGRGRLLTHPVPYDWSRPDRECALDLLRSAGISAESALPELWLDDSERRDGTRLTAPACVPPKRMLVGMQPGANDPRVREWGSDKFAMLGDRLADEQGAGIVLFGSADEIPISREVAVRMKHAPTILTGETSLRQALGAISQCDLWIGNDGGLLHAATALGPATVGIFGPTKAARWGYNQPGHRTVAHIGGRNKGTAVTADEIRRSLDSIEVDEVYSIALTVMKEGTDLTRTRPERETE